MRRAAISRRASTVGLSSFSALSICASAPLASGRARLAAIITSSKRLSTTSRQSSTVMRAITLPAAGRAVDSRDRGPGILRDQVPATQASGREIKHLQGVRRRQSLGSGFSRGLLSSSAPGARGWSRSHKGDERLLPRQQRLDQLRVALRLDPPAQPAGGEDRAHLVDGGIEVLVDDDVVELVVVRHLLAGRRQAPGHDGLAILAALAHALVERLARRRQDEHADSIGHLLAHLARALPVDLQQRSEEHTSELQSLMRISYAVFCLKKKKKHTH